MKIYTKTGDEGRTGLFGGERVSKTSARVWAYGEVDELNSALGLVRSQLDSDELDTLLSAIQCELFDIGAELASTPGRREKGSMPLIDEPAVTRLEEAIDRHQESLPPLETFILPGGTPAAAHLHLARTVCRRAERRVVALTTEDAVRPILLRYLNRLSDLLFVLARVANDQAGVKDVPWLGREGR
ncbi:MAG TPA: cob(I)yrinic acid a,c-diamide adenosyltransferase [Polyangiaceae bacterium LLY-WYZ-15_(1-7)]|nr:ATP:cob(I)alamin adenosyltransferase [Sandaracinus sp.]HJK95298.1 cob(I)yrinic acid a,c-diamide adenosyltransferase [Polyangiaceae bacterium LLY-WYZ-15_(1-7)]MBJ74297.1 ATP:cob(I)alamin adenosyltransferase [Sandaracinus sp.]HJL05992.1 cob(I)yrinic acid a,c-diamide adenosyltransferase [Polyangiaceae bacterium LLY-WYZ-15_(1-7)]HJL10173.1 cob(I)yrinic acid a,c-diamide adenosyltransferase [Polyangiaceae bacterium LLY-WYZ-15_(1-7)]